MYTKDEQLGSSMPAAGVCELVRGEVKPASGEVNGERERLLFVGVVRAHKCTHEWIRNAEFFCFINRKQS